MEKIETIIEDLCSHTITKREAVIQLRKITDSIRNNRSVEAIVESKGFTVPDNHGYIRLKVPYCSEKLDVFSRGEKVDILIIP